MKNQLFKFRCRLLYKTGCLWWKNTDVLEDFEYVLGGHHYESVAVEEVSKYLKEQFGWWPRRIDNEDMKSDKYWQIDLIAIGDRGKSLNQKNN